jgi:hypothetical protein
MSWCEALKGPREARRAELLARTAEGEPLTRITRDGDRAITWNVP